MVKIISDTTACLPDEIRNRYKIPIVPQMIHFGETSYTEGVDIDNKTFLNLLGSADDLPKTSAPSPELFKELFTEFSSSEEPIICIHPSSELSPRKTGMHLLWEWVILLEWVLVFWFFQAYSQLWVF